MPKDTKTLGNSKARACESLGFVHKKGCARVLTQPLLMGHSFDYLTVNAEYLHKPTLSKPACFPASSLYFDTKCIELHLFCL